MSLRDTMTPEEREAAAEALAKIKDLANASTKLGQAVGICLGTTEALEAKIKTMALASAQLGMLLQQTTEYAQALEKRIGTLEREAGDTARLVDAVFGLGGPPGLLDRVAALEAKQGASAAPAGGLPVRVAVIRRVPRGALSVVLEHRAGLTWISPPALEIVLPSRIEAARLSEEKPWWYKPGWDEDGL